MGSWPFAVVVICLCAAYADADYVSYTDQRRQETSLGDVTDDDIINKCKLSYKNKPQLLNVDQPNSNSEDAVFTSQQVIHNTRHDGQNYMSIFPATRQKQGFTGIPLECIVAGVIEHSQRGMFASKNNDAKLKPVTLMAKRNPQDKNTNKLKKIVDDVRRLLIKRQNLEFNPTGW